MKRIFGNPIFWCIIGILAVSTLVLWPLARPGFFVSDDGDWMVIRLSAFFQSFREGQFPVRFLGRLNNGFGYPVANFLYPGFLYLGTLIHILGISFPDTVKLIFAGSVIASAFFVFLWLRQKFSWRASLLGSLNFILSPYLLFDIYKRGSVGEVLALLPAAIAFYSIDSGKFWLLPWAVGFLIISHNSLALMLLALITLYLLVKKQWRLFIPIAIGLGMATFFWLPAQYELKYVIFHKIAVSNPVDYFVGGNLVMLLGFAGIAAAILLLLTSSKKLNKERFIFLLFFIIAIVFSTPLSFPVWKNQTFNDLFQFPFRFLAVNLFAGSFLIADALEAFTEHFVKIAFLFAVFWLVPLPSVFSGIRWVERPLGFYTTNEATTTVSDEYMPVWVTSKPENHAGQRIIIYKGRGQLNVTQASSQHIEADVNLSEESTIEVNLIYYPGWGVTVDSERVPINYGNSSGLMRFQVAQGKHHLMADFRETVPRFLADLISFVFGGVALIYSIEVYKKQSS